MQTLFLYFTPIFAHFYPLLNQFNHLIQHFTLYFPDIYPLIYHFNPLFYLLLILKFHFIIYSLSVDPYQPLIYVILEINFGATLEEFFGY